MEMADYERLVKELNAKLVERDQSAEELKAQINTLNHKEDTLKQEIGTYETFMYNVLYIWSPFTDGKYLLFLHKPDDLQGPLLYFLSFYIFVVSLQFQAL